MNANEFFLKKYFFEKGKIFMLYEMKGGNKHSCQSSKPKIRIIKVENSENKNKNRNKNLFCISEYHILILLHTLQYKHVIIRFKSPLLIGRNVSENFYVSL